MIKGHESDVASIDFERERLVHISTTICRIEIGFGSKCSILNGQLVNIYKSNIVHMQLK